jgi:hypothetical protein
MGISDLRTFMWAAAVLLFVMAAGFFVNRYFRLYFAKKTKAKYDEDLKIVDRNLAQVLEKVKLRQRVFEGLKKEANRYGRN